MPAGLPIDHAKSLNGTMAPYAEQVLVCTGKEDWLSKIEDENSGDNLAADIKELMGRGGTYSDVCSPLIDRAPLSIIGRSLLTNLDSLITTSR